MASADVSHFAWPSHFAWTNCTRVQFVETNDYSLAAARDQGRGNEGE